MKSLIITVLGLFSLGLAAPSSTKTPQSLLHTTTDEYLFD
jgi:hypothetical protein